MHTFYLLDYVDQQNGLINIQNFRKEWEKKTGQIHFSSHKLLFSQPLCTKLSYVCNDLKLTQNFFTHTTWAP